MGYVPLLEHAIPPLEGEELFSHNYFSSVCTLPSISLPPSHEKSHPLSSRNVWCLPRSDGVSYRFYTLKKDHITRHNTQL